MTILEYCGTGLPLNEKKPQHISKQAGRRCILFFTGSDYRPVKYCKYTERDPKGKNSTRVTSSTSGQIRADLI